MENWLNLNKLLLLEKKETDIRNELAKKLMEAATANSKEKAKKALKAGASLNSFDESLTPLIVCIENDFLDLAKFFIRSGANINYRPHEKFVDALWYAVINKKHDFLEIFIESKPALTRQYETNKTLLMYSTIESDANSVRALLKHSSIKVNERDGLGNTALHYNMSKSSPSQDDIDIGKMLIAAGADTNLPNMEGNTPKDLAVDFTAKSVLLHSELENQIVEKEEEDLASEIEKERGPGVSVTKGNKIKI